MVRLHQVKLLIFILWLTELFGNTTVLLQIHLQSESDISFLGAVYRGGYYGRPLAWI